MKRLLSVLSAAIALASFALLFGCGGEGSAYDSYDDGSFSAGSGSVTSATKIDIEWGAGAVVVKTSASASGISFSETGGSDRKDLALRYRLNGGELDLKFAASGAKLPQNFSKNLTVTLPAGVRLSSLEIDTHTGNVTVEDVSAQEIVAESGVGNVTVDGCTFAEGDFETTTGDITLFLTDSGFRCEFECVSGNIFDDFGTTHEGNVFTYGDGSVRFQAKTGTGDLKLKRAE